MHPVLSGFGVSPPVNANTKFSWGLSVSTPVLKLNGDFALVFCNFVILPLRFQNEGRLYPYSVKST